MSDKEDVKKIVKSSIGTKFVKKWSANYHTFTFLTTILPLYSI